MSIAELKDALDAEATPLATEARATLEAYQRASLMRELFIASWQASVTCWWFALILWLCA